MRSADYRAQLSNGRLPELARHFICAAMCDESHDPRSAAMAKLHAAWVCDDDDLDDSARNCRRGAIELLAGADPQDDPKKALVEGAIVVDMLRRVGDFKTAEETCDALFERADETMQAVLKYQRSLIQARDTACHRVVEAVG